MEGGGGPKTNEKHSGGGLGEGNIKGDRLRKRKRGFLPFEKNNPVSGFGGLTRPKISHRFYE